jgi:hypothetical protein
MLGRKRAQFLGREMLLWVGALQPIAGGGGCASGLSNIAGR